MKIVVVGMCSAAESRHSQRTGKDYFVTTFVESPSLKSFEFFGDFGLVASREDKEYIFEASLSKDGKVEFPKLISVTPVPAPAPAVNKPAPVK